MRKDEGILEAEIKTYSFCSGDIVTLRPADEIRMLFPGSVAEDFLCSAYYLDNVGNPLVVKRMTSTNGFYDVGWGGVNGKVLIPAIEPVAINEDEVLELMFE